MSRYLLRIPTHLSLSKKSGWSWAFSDRYGRIKTDEAGTLDFSGVPAFLVTNAFIVQRSAAKMFNIVSGPQLLSIHQGFCDYRPGFQCPWTHDP